MDDMLGFILDTDPTAKVDELAEEAKRLAEKYPSGSEPAETPKPEPLDDASTAYVNTDRELYREPAESEGMSYYANSIHVTEQGNIGMNVGGYVIVRPIADWHKAMAALLPPIRPSE